MSPLFNMGSAAFPSRLMDKPQAGHPGSRAERGCLPGFPHRLQSCDVCFGSTFPTHLPARAALEGSRATQGVHGCSAIDRARG